MKMRLVTIQLIGVVMLVLAGLPFHLSQINMITSCYAKDKNNDNDNGKGNKHQVPEPTTLTLLQAGIGGAAICLFIRRNRKK